MTAHMQSLARADELVCPQLPASPLLAMQQMQQVIETYLATHSAQSLSVIGSSLGGYYATWLAERYGCKAVLLNPAVKPPRDLASYVGVTTQYHSDEVFEFKPEYVDELRAYAVATITRPERYFLFAAKGDEVLDWRDMVQHYPQARQCVLEGSNHALNEFVEYIDQILEFCDAY
jgi:predicted esterase YcpF (UPF0227 family)